MNNTLVIYDHAGPAQGVLGSTLVASNSPFRTDDNNPEIYGTGNPGDTVTVYDGVMILGENLDPAITAYNDKLWIGASSVNSDGTWDLSYADEMPSGRHHITAIHKDDTGKTTDVQVSEFIITQGLAPVITEIRDNDQSNSLVQNYSETNSANITIHGTAEPGYDIDIYDNGIKIGSTATGRLDDYSGLVSGAGWMWQFTPDQPLTPNVTHVFSAVATSIQANDFLFQGSASVSTEYSYTIGIGATPDQPALLAPVITSVVDDVGVNQGAVADGGQTNDMRPTLHGTSEPGTVVTISDNGHAIGTATTGADWQWSFTPSADLVAGANTLSVSAARADGTGSVAAWYTHGLDVTPSLDAVLATAGLSAAPAVAPTAPAPTVQAAYVSEAATAAVLPQHDLAY